MASWKAFVQLVLLPTSRVRARCAKRYDGFIVGGSYSGAYEVRDVTWIQALSTQLQQMRARQVPMLGICFGHQILAQALGGTVIKNPKGLWPCACACAPAVQCSAGSMRVRAAGMSPLK